MKNLFLTNSDYLELTSELTALIVEAKFGDEAIVNLEDSTRYTEEAQDYFNNKLSDVEDIVQKLGIRDRSCPDTGLNDSEAEVSLNITESINIEFGFNQHKENGSEKVTDLSQEVKEVLKMRGIKYKLTPHENWMTTSEGRKKSLGVSYSVEVFNIPVRQVDFYIELIQNHGI